MFNYFRALFVRHNWLETDEAHRLCLVCGRHEARDIQVEILGPNPWFKTVAGRVALHFSDAAASETTPAPMPVTAPERVAAE